jgi:hypothetical protein
VSGNNIYPAGYNCSRLLRLGAVTAEGYIVGGEGRIPKKVRISVFL